jgi:glycosyl transferase family 25
VIPTFVINLERDVERRAAMAVRLDALNIPHRFLKAIDGRRLSNDDLRRMSPARSLAYPRALLPNEVACGMSHLAAISEGSRLDCDFFCVLEDDTTLASALPNYLLGDLLRSLPSFDVLRLFTHFDRWEKPSKIVGYHGGVVVVSMLRPGWGAQGQIYSRSGAKKVLAGMTCIRAPFDYALYHDCLVSGLRVLETRPGLVDRDWSKESSIGERPDIVHPNTFGGRTRRNAIRVQRKFRAAVSFLSAWGPMELLSFLPLWR